MIKEGQQYLGVEQQPTAVERVGEGAADDGQGQEREELAEREQPDLEGRVRQVVELERSRHRGDLAAEGRDRLPDEQPAEGRVASERAEVDRQTAQPSRRPDLGRLH